MNRKHLLAHDIKGPLTQAEFEEKAQRICAGEGSSDESFSEEIDESYGEEDKDHLSPDDVQTDVDKIDPNDSNVSFNDDEDVQPALKKYYVGKDKQSKWLKEIPRPTKTRSKNIISHLPGVKLSVGNASSPVKSFLSIMTDEIFQIIVDKSNENIQVVRNKFAREIDALDTNVAKMKAFVGILLMCGMYRACHLSYMFNADGTGIEFVRMCMSAKRFLFLLRCIRFDSLTARADQCKTNYTPGEYLTINEMLIPFRCRCSFKQYIPNKPAKYGLKMYSLVGARTFYTYNLELYVGKQLEGEFHTSNSPVDVVKRPVEPIRDTNRNITCDNWYFF